MFLDKKFEVTVIGSATKDVFLDITNKPIKLDGFTTGEAICFGLASKVAIDKMTFTSGGGGGNMAVTFARQGIKTACIASIADDFNGKEIVEELKSEGVNTDFFQHHNDSHTAYSCILVSEGGERTILSYKGEGQHFDVKNINFKDLKTDWLVLNNLGGHFDLLETAVNWAIANNVKLAMNPGNKELEHGIDKLKPLLKKFSIIIMNQEEAANLTGISYTDEKAIFKFMDEAVDGIFVMTKGPGGVSASDGKNIYSAGVPDSPVIERTGAGDAFCSGFVTEFIRSGDISKAIQFGTANASSVVMYYGGKEGILKKNGPGKWPLVEVSIMNI